MVSGRGLTGGEIGRSEYGSINRPDATLVEGRLDGLLDHDATITYHMFWTLHWTFYIYNTTGIYISLYLAYKESDKLLLHTSLIRGLVYAPILSHSTSALSQSSCIPPGAFSHSPSVSSVEYLHMALKAM